MTWHDQGRRKCSSVEIIRSKELPQGSDSTFFLLPVNNAMLRFNFHPSPHIIHQPILSKPPQTLLILARSSLAGFLSPTKSAVYLTTSTPASPSYQLLQIPSADLHIPTILVQAVGQTLGSRLTALLRPAVVLIPLLGLRRDGVVVLLAFGHVTAAGVAAAEHAADGVPDGGADCYTTMFKSAIDLVRVVMTKWVKA